MDFDLFRWSFEVFLKAMLLAWLPMQLSALLLVYYFFNLWDKSYQKFKSSRINFLLLKFFKFNNIIIFYFILAKINVLFFVLYLVYLSLLIMIPLIIVHQVSISCRLVILMEQVYNLNAFFFTILKLFNFKSHEFRRDC